MRYVVASLWVAVEKATTTRVFAVLAVITIVSRRRNIKRQNMEIINNGEQVDMARKKKTAGPSIGDKVKYRAGRGYATGTVAEVGQETAKITTSGGKSVSRRLEALFPAA
jgi:hypothetical protein